jgi:hypothetical protein
LAGLNASEPHTISSGHQLDEVREHFYFLAAVQGFRWPSGKAL